MCADIPGEGGAALQGAFAQALLGATGKAPAGLTRAHRFGVYRNNVLASLTGVLRAYYPVVARLVGEDFFLASAREFVRAHPPATPVLLEYGAGFASFLEKFAPAGGIAYLADVARLEWLRHAAYHAADCRALTAQDLGAIAPEDAAGLTFEPHPSAGLIASPYPIVSIWETNTYETEVRPIGPGLPGEAALVIRPDLEVTVLRLDEAEYVFAAELCKGATLKDAAAGADAHGNFNLTQSLAKLIRAGAFAGFTAPPRQRGV